MIYCKKTIIAACFTLMLPLAVWSEAPVVDDSDNFAIIDGQQMETSGVHPKYDDPQIESAQIDGPQNENYQTDQGDDGPALVKEEQSNDSHNTVNDSAKLIDKFQALQHDIQELRGQLEVQAHELKILKEQQLTFYKDLDSRLGNTTTAKSSPLKTTTDLSVGSTTPASMQLSNKKSVTPVTKATTPVPIPVSRMNPADEQISYMAAYELVKNKRYDDATKAMHLFVQKYPNGGYTANAEYWLGELYLVKKDYPKALEHLNTVLEKFPSSSKSAASQLKAGYAYAASGNNQEAKVRFQNVLKTYPGTPTAKLARIKLEAINAS